MAGPESVSFSKYQYTDLSFEKTKNSVLGALKYNANRNYNSIYIVGNKKSFIFLQFSVFNTNIGKEGKRVI